MPYWPYCNSTASSMIILSWFFLILLPVSVFFSFFSEIQLTEGRSSGAPHHINYSLWVFTADSWEFLWILKTLEQPTDQMCYIALIWQITPGFSHSSAPPPTPLLPYFLTLPGSCMHRYFTWVRTKNAYMYFCLCYSVQRKDILMFDKWMSTHRVKSDLTCQRELFPMKQRLEKCSGLQWLPNVHV